MFKAVENCSKAGYDLLYGIGPGTGGSQRTKIDIGGL